MSRFTIPERGNEHCHPGLLSVADLDAEVFWQLVGRACDLFADPTDHDFPLHGRVFGVLFTKTSTRTRTAFSTGVLRLGGDVVPFGPGELQTNTGETWADTARVFGSMLDGLVVRTAGPLAALREFAHHSGIPLVNAMATEEHPSQAVCDVATLALTAPQRDLRGVRMVYLGEGNNTATALANAMAFVPESHTTFATPPGYGLPLPLLEAATARGRAVDARLTQVHDVEGLDPAAEVVYTTRWQTTGTQKPDPNWRTVFQPFAVTAALMENWPEAVFLHDLPAHRGEEVTAAVLDGPRSLAWTQARMKLASAMAILEWVATTG